MRNAIVTWKYYSVDSETLKGWQPALISSEDSHDDHEATSLQMYNLWQSKTILYT